jgi:hypothetical protein
MLSKLRLIIGWTAIILPFLHILSDLFKVFGGGFSTVFFLTNLFFGKV